MDLRERLERLRQNFHPSSPRTAEAERNRETAETPVTACRACPSIEDLVPGTLVETSCGPAFHSEETYPLAHRHGEVPLHSIHEVTSEGFAHLLRDQAPIDLARTLQRRAGHARCSGGPSLAV